MKPLTTPNVDCCLEKRKDPCRVTSEDPLSNAHKPPTSGHLSDFWVFAVPRILVLVHPYNSDPSCKPVRWPTISGCLRIVASYSCPSKTTLNFLGQSWFRHPPGVLSKFHRKRSNTETENVLEPPKKKTKTLNTPKV